MKLFTVHDCKAEAYLPPVVYKTKGEALRAFETACKDTDSNFNKYPSDYNFLEIGEWDERTAMIQVHGQPIILANASEYAH